MDNREIELAALKEETSLKRIQIQLTTTSTILSLIFLLGRLMQSEKFKLLDFSLLVGVLCAFGIMTWVLLKKYHAILAKMRALYR